MKRLVMILMICIMMFGSVIPAHAGSYDPYTCSVKGCSNPQYLSSNYCKEHKCGKCKLRREENGLLCSWCRVTSVCTYNNCGKHVDFPNGACKEHMCTEGGVCGNIKVVGYDKCARHLGLVPKKKAYQKSYSSSGSYNYYYDSYEDDEEESYSNNEKHRKHDNDPYDCCDYSNGDDFAEDWYSEFDGDCWEDKYDDAYDYWEWRH